VNKTKNATQEKVLYPSHQNYKMEDNRMDGRAVCVNLLAGLALITSAQAVRSQVTSDWSVANATPQQTRFANVTFGGPPAGILWRATNSIASSGIVTDGLLVLRSNSNSVGTTRIYDAENGQCLYTFPETDMAVDAFGKLGTRTILFHGLHVVDYSQKTAVVALTAYDLGPILAVSPGRNLQRSGVLIFPCHLRCHRF